MWQRLVESILLDESVSTAEINDAIDNHKRIIINYDAKTTGIAPGSRVIEVYAYGLTKAGNPVIRAFQPYGDTYSRVPSWKFFRLDGITNWEATEQTFSRPASEIYKGIGEFNPNGDNSMSVVYKIADFNGAQGINPPQTDATGPKYTDNVYKTDTEKGAERLKQQLDNPIYLSDIKNKDAFKTISRQQSAQKDTGPKMSDDAEKKDDLYKTDTERGMENLRNQLENPRKIDLSQFDRKKHQEELDQLRQKLGNEGERMNFGDFNRKLTEPEQSDLYKTDTERGMENLRKQLENPRKIDLDKIPRR